MPPAPRTLAGVADRSCSPQPCEEVVCLRLPEAYSFAFPEKLQSDAVGLSWSVWLWDWHLSGLDSCFTVSFRSLILGENAH